MGHVGAVTGVRQICPIAPQLKSSKSSDVAMLPVFLYNIVKLHAASVNYIIDPIKIAGQAQILSQWYPSRPAWTKVVQNKNNHDDS